MEGQDTSARKKIWEDLASTEMRLELMSELLKLNLGLADVEEFNLNLKGNLRNKPTDKVSEMLDKKLVRAAMGAKMQDEKVTRGKLIRCRNKERTEIMRKLGNNSKPYRGTIRNLRSAAMTIKTSQRKLYAEKIQNLRCKYRENEEEKLDKIPNEMQEFITLSVFDREKFERVNTLTYEVTCVGDLNLIDEQKSIFRLHPNFSIIENLQDDSLEFEQEVAYCKARMTLHKELDETETEEKMSPEQEQFAEEEDARSRLTFDPLTKTYNDRKRRVKDLEECSRVTLPRPLPTKHETYIEMRRGIHSKIVKDYREKNAINTENKHQI